MSSFGKQDFPGLINHLTHNNKTSKHDEVQISKFIEIRVYK